MQIEADEGEQTCCSQKSGKDIEPGLLIEGFLLDDLNGHHFASASQRVPDLQGKAVCPPGQVGIVGGSQVAAAEDGCLPVEALQLTAHQGIHQRIVEYVAVDRDLPHPVVDPEIPVHVRIDPQAVRVEIGDDRLEIADLHHRILDVHFGHAGFSGDVKINVIRKLAVGV